MTTEHIHRFAFGDNWEKFSRTVSQSKIDEAVENLKRVTGEQTLAGNSFLDIGCGSGLHALAAIKLAAATVTAFDVDPQSVQTTKNILAAYATGVAVNVEQQNILSATADNGKKYDIVYSWGVLHHTGDMWGAIKQAARFVNADGTFILAIYKKTPLCGFWRIEKAIYSRLPAFLQFPVTTLFSFAYLLGVAFTGTNPVAYVKNYHSDRGMNFWYNMIDWLGGYPYQSATPAEIRSFLKDLEFETVADFNTAPSRAFGLFGTGCAEYVFRRRMSGVS